MISTKTISLSLLATFIFALFTGVSLQLQLKAIGISQEMACKITPTHSAAAVLNLVRESLEDSENRRTTVTAEADVIENSSAVTRPFSNSAFASDFKHPFNCAGKLYLRYCRLLI